MSSELVTVAIPVRDGAAVLAQTLAAVRGQRLDAEVELLVCDSGSRDTSVAIARDGGAEVIEIVPARFSHGATRNLLMERSRGARVAFLTQDALPADEHWLARLLSGFELADDVGLVFGPYRPRPDASTMVVRELDEWFASFAPGGGARIDRLMPDERELPVRSLLGPRGFFTDANGCVARAAWKRAPFREALYAEDHMLAHDMLRAGFAKVYLADAAVIHSHDYSGPEWLRRSFDEARALRAVYGFVEPLGPRSTLLKIWGLTGSDWRWARANAPEQAHGVRVLSLLARSARHHALRTAGSVLGGRASRLPPMLTRGLSLEGRDR